MQQPVPDTKDWTWSICESCGDCGFDPAEVSRDDVAELTRDYAAVIAEAARAGQGAVRPAPAVWSAAEYACHVRDVCSIFLVRLRRMLTEDDPLFANWDQDAAALEGQYWTQRPGLVAGQLIAAADVLADQFAGVSDAQWLRPGHRSNGSVFTVDTLAVYLLHDLAHHAHDVSRRCRPPS